MPARLFFLFVSACLMTAAPLFAQPEGDFKNVQREIYRSWIAYLNSLDSVSGKYETHDTLSDGSAESTACRFVYSYPFIKVELIGAENAVETISVYNAKYHFRLQTASPETAIENISDMRPFKGTLTLLPDHYWLPVKTEAQILEGEEGTIAVENRYDFSHSVPILAEQTRSFTKPSESGTGRIAVSDVRENVAVDPEEFTLSSYGFSEPRFALEPASRVRAVLIGLGLALVILAVFKLRKKRLSAEPPKSGGE